MTEECEDGNVTEGDRCSAMCAIEHPEVCPGTDIHLDLGESVTIKDTTVGASDKFIGSRTGIGNCGGADYPGPDLIYAVIPSVNGTLRAELDSDYDDPFVRARPMCTSPKSEEIRCNFRTDPGLTSINFPVTAGTKYYVAADAWNDDAGTFTLKLSLE